MSLQPGAGVTDGGSTVLVHLLVGGVSSCGDRTRNGWEVEAVTGLGQGEVGVRAVVAQSLQPRQRELGEQAGGPHCIVHPRNHENPRS